MDELVLIAAIAAPNRVIGSGNTLPWHIPADLCRFKQLTLGSTVIMGRRTWDSLPGPLSQRHNIVVSRQLAPYTAVVAPETMLDIVPSLAEAWRLTQTARAFIIGGATLYGQTLAQADRLELTIVEGHYEGDVLFPPYQAILHRWFQQVSCEKHVGFRFETYRHRSKERQLPAPSTIARSRQTAD